MITKKLASIFAFTILSVLGLTNGHAEEPRHIEHLEWLAGEWDFVLGDRSGTRKYVFAVDGYALNWKETFSGSDVVGEGYVLIEENRETVLTASLHNQPGAFEVWQGKISEDKNSIYYKPVFAPHAMSFEMEWRKISEAEFQYIAYDISGGGKKIRWRATFTRSTE